MHDPKLDQTPGSPQDPYAYLRETLGLRWVAPYYVDDHGTKLTISLNVHSADRALTVNNMQCLPERTGLGTRVIEALQEYAQDTGLILEANEVNNTAFWDRFDIPYVLRLVLAQSREDLLAELSAAANRTSGQGGN